METSLCLGRKFGVTVQLVNLIPICGHEQPPFSATGHARHRPRFTRTDMARRHSWHTTAEFASGPKPKFTAYWHCPAGFFGAGDV